MINSLRIFCDLVKTENFTKTAVQHHITQSAVSHHIRSLEEKFNQRLFVRERQSLRLTDAGKEVYRASSYILRRYEQLEKDLKVTSHKIAGPIRIATTIAAGLHDLPMYAGPFMKKYPEVTIEPIYLKGMDIYNRVLDHRADFGFVPCPIRHPSLNILVIKKCQAVIITPKSYPDKKYVLADLPDLFKNPFIAIAKDHFGRKAADIFLSNLGIRPNICHTFDNVESIKQAVEMGLGIAIVPESTVQNEAKLKKIKIIRAPEGSWEYPLAVITRKNTELSFTAHALVEHIRTSHEH